MNSTEVILFGGGGGAVEIARYIVDSNAELQPAQRVVVTDLLVDEGVGRIEDLQQVVGHAIRSHTSIATIESLEAKKFVNTLGLLPIRNQKYRSLKEQGARFLTVIHPSAIVSPTAKLEEGCIVSPLSMVGEFAKLGADIFMNVGATIGHDVTVGESSIISPHVALCGGVSCGTGVYFGAGVTVNPGVKIGNRSKLSSGAVVTGEIEPGAIAFGNPCKSRKIFCPETGLSLFHKKS